MAGESKKGPMKLENSDSPKQETEEDSEFEESSDESDEEVEDIAQDDNHFTLFVEHVPEDVTEHEIRSVFEKHGNVIGVRRPKTKKKKEEEEEEEYEDNNCCFVTFGSKEEADKAVEVLNGSHTFPGSYSPIIVVLCRSTINVTLDDCFENLERFSFDENVDEKQEQLRRHMMSMGHMAAESLLWILEQAKKDGVCLPKDSPLDAIESGELTVDEMAKLIMKPLDGMLLPKGEKRLKDQKERKDQDVGMVERQLPEKLEGKRIPSKEKKVVGYIKKKKKMNEEKKGKEHSKEETKEEEHIKEEMKEEECSKEEETKEGGHIDKKRERSTPKEKVETKEGHMKRGPQVKKRRTKGSTSRERK